MRVYGENYGLSPARFKSKTWKCYSVPFETQDRVPAVIIFSGFKC
jgi:hypothetical protein